MSTIDVGMRLGDAIDPFHLANGFEAVIGYECQERSNHPFSHSYDTYNTCPTVIDIDHNPLFVALKIETYDVAYSHQNGDWFSGSLYDTAEEVVFEV